MKLRGNPLSLPEPIPFKFYRGPNEYVILCKAILDYKPFSQLCPEPVPPTVTPVKGVPYKDYNDKKYAPAVEKWRDLRWKWIVIESLSATPDLEWGDVKPNDPSTWDNLDKDLNSVFTPAEVTLLYNTIHEAQAPTQKTTKSAMDSFILGLDPTDQDSPSQNTEPLSTQSGELVKESESDHPA